MESLRPAPPSCPPPPPPEPYGCRDGWSSPTLAQVGPCWFRPTHTALEVWFCMASILHHHIGHAHASKWVKLDLHLAIAPWWCSTHSSFTRTTGIQFTSVSRRKTGSLWLFGAPKETNILVECSMLHLQRVSFPKEMCLQTHLSHEKKRLVGLYRGLYTTQLHRDYDKPL